jgi:hypothetical protein
MTERKNFENRLKVFKSVKYTEEIYGECKKKKEIKKIVFTKEYDIVQ